LKKIQKSVGSIDQEIRLNSFQGFTVVPSPRDGNGSYTGPARFPNISGRIPNVIDLIFGNAALVPGMDDLFRFV